MSYPNYPRVKAELTDGNLRFPFSAESDRIMLLGTTTNTALTLFEPYDIVGATRASDFDNLDGSASELSLAIEEAREAGAQYVSCMVISNTETPSNDNRFNYLASAYDLLLDVPARIVVPVNARIDSALSSSNNFAHQLAWHCYNATANFYSRRGVIGTEPITSTSSVSVSELRTWVTALAAFDTTSLQGDAFTIYDGVTDANNDGVPDNYAFWATEDGSIPTGAPPASDSDVLKDDNNNPIDIGKFIDVVAGQYRAYNGYAANQYRTLNYYQTDGAAAYAAMQTTLLPEVSPTNRKPGGIAVITNLSIAQANTLAGKRFVVFRETAPDGVAVVNAMTGAWNISSTYRSDYTRNTTMRIMIDLVSMVRRLSKPFIGLGNSVLNRISLEAQIRAELSNRIQRGELQAADVRMIATPTMQVLGQLLIDLTITPVFEITEITERFGLAMPTA